MISAEAQPVGAGAFRVVNDFARSTSWLHGAAIAVATYGVAVMALLAVAVALVSRSRGSARGVAASVWGVLAALLALFLNQPISHLVGERRPFVTLPNVLLLVPHGTDFGFASDHSIIAGAVAAGLLIAYRRWGLAAALCAVLIAFSRTYIGVHFPQDVVAGLLLGALVTWVGWRLLGGLLVRAVAALARGRGAWLVRSPGAPTVPGDRVTA